MRGFAVLAALTLVAGCHQVPTEVKVTDAWVRLPAVAGNPGAAYFTLNAADKPLTLIAVSAHDVAVRTELHESMKDAAPMAMASMQPLKEVSLPAGGSVAFAPGGKHVMLFDVSPKVAAGSHIRLALAFSDGKTIETQATVVGAGDPAPK